MFSEETHISLHIQYIYVQCIYLQYLPSLQIKKKHAYSGYVIMQPYYLNDMGCDDIGNK